MLIILEYDSTMEKRKKGDKIQRDCGLETVFLREYYMWASLRQ